MLLMLLERHRAIRAFHYFLEEYQFLNEIKATVPITQKSITFGNNTIAFLIPKFNAFAGGVTSILRLGTYLSEFGHNVSYIIIGEDSEKRAIDNAHKCLPYYKGRICLADAMDNNYDIGIATYWTTAYLLQLKQSQFAIKAYFIQDFEPGFYPAGEQFYLALNTYNIGLFMISLGTWCKEQIESKLNTVQVESVPFPYENKQYSTNQRNIIIDKELKLAVYLKNIPSRSPAVIIMGLKLLDGLLKEKGIVLNASIFGIDSCYELGIGKNLGKIDATTMHYLYENSHIGLASSLTNVSLVPYEMMACGLPVVDFKEGSASHFFPDTCIELANVNPYNLANTILNLATNPNRLNQIAMNGKEFIKHQTWEKTANLFNDKLSNYIKKLPEANKK